MKNLKYFLLSIMIASLWSCDIDRDPFQDVADEVVFSDVLGVEAAALGTYAILKQNTFMRPYHFHGEFGGDNIALSGATTDHLYFMYNFQHVPNNYHLNDLWVDSYKGIINCNKIIENADRTIGPRMDHVIGEMYYLRAFFYHTLVNIWGRPYSQDPHSNLGVPIKTDVDRDNVPPRATVAQVYDLIVEDLLNAAEYMSEYNRGPNEMRIYASREAAWAYLSRVYLYMGENEKAIEFASKVIDSGKFSLLQGEAYTKYPTFVPELNQETIFACRSLKDEDDYNWYAVGGMYARIDGVGWGEMYASQPYRDLVGQYPEDLRNEFILPQYTEGTDEQGNPLMWIIYIRTTDQAEGKKMFTTYNVTKNYDTGIWSYVKDDVSLEVFTETEGEKTLYYIFENNVKTYVNLERRMLIRNGYPQYFVNKCSNQEDQPQLWSPVISRLAEMYLNRAEAYAKLGNEGAAISDINVLRQRAGIPLYNSDIEIPSGKTVFDVVMEERQMELAFEAHRRYDIFRNNLTLDRRYPGTHDRGSALMQVAPTHPRVVEYIPEPQLLAQPNLINNP
ncbi:MAG: RagB/SusD family nutrient uptake outer membrane protein [Bacteroidetes bacterium]|nr:MAG: RagB/SusD family nutrient uptake outer membrane protein [Bacteroidota bacterium]